MVNCQSNVAEAKKLNFVVDSASYEKIEKYCADRSISISAFLRNASNNFLAGVERKTH